MAHEFKTPLTSIISLITTLLSSYDRVLENNNIDENNIYDTKKKHKKVDKEAIKTLNLIQNLSRYVIFLTSDIIHYSNPNNINDIQLNNQKINFREISTFCFDILNSLLYCNISKMKKINSKLIYDDLLDNLEIFSDEVRIKQILLNFISNSVKFTNEGFIKLKFSKSIEKNQLIISLEDSGIGIRKEDQLFLFRDYSKLEKNNIINSLNDNNIGSGLGLSICKNLAEKLKMNINLQSDYGKGTIMSLNINYENLENDLNMIIKNKYQSNSDNFNSTLNEGENKKNKNYNLNNEIENTKNILLYNSYKQESKCDNLISFIDNHNDSHKDNILIKSKRSINKNFQDDQLKKKSLFNEFAFPNSTRDKNFKSNADYVLSKFKGNKILKNKTYSISENLDNFSYKKIYNKSDLINNLKLENLKINYNIENRNYHDEPYFKKNHILEMNFLKHHKKYYEKNKNNPNKYGKLQKISNKDTIKENKQNPSSFILNNTENNHVRFF